MAVFLARIKQKTLFQYVLPDTLFVRHHKYKHFFETTNARGCQISKIYFSRLNQALIITANQAFCIPMSLIGKSKGRGSSPPIRQKSRLPIESFCQKSLLRIETFIPMPPPFRLYFATISPPFRHHFKSSLPIHLLFSSYFPIILYGESLYEKTKNNIFVIRKWGGNGGDMVAKYRGNGEGG